MARIPSITDMLLKRLSRRIKPVGRVEPGEPLRFYARCNPRDNFSFYGDLRKPAQKLVEVARIEMWHRADTTMGVYQFMPSAAEVYAQIPEDILPRVVAFETLTPDFGGKLEEAPHLHENKHTYHRATTVLYTKQ